MNKNAQNVTLFHLSSRSAAVKGLLLLLMFPSVLLAQFTVTINNGTVTITKYNGYGGAVTIPATLSGLPVTGIGTGAFLGSTNLTSITIGSNITTIGIEAFDGCSKLSSVTIPAGVTNIGEGAFSYCTGLTGFTVDAANPSYSAAGGVLFNKSQTVLVGYPGGQASDYTIPNTVTNIGGEAFGGCTQLSSIKMGNSVTSIGVSAFWRCEWLVSMMIGNGVAHIGNYAFSGCSRLNSVRIPASVTSIGDGALQSPGLASVYFVGSPPITGLNVLGVNNNVVVYYFRGTAGWGPLFAGRPTVEITEFFTYSSINGQVTISGYNGPSVVTIPSTINGLPVITIGVEAFLNRYYLTSITIPNSVTRILSDAFKGCVSLTTVCCTGNAPSVFGVPSNLFNGDNDATVYYFQGNTGWGSTFGGRPTVLWNPQVQASSPNFGVRSNRFGFTINGSTNIPLVVEACTNLSSPVWVSRQSCTLTNGSLYFNDPKWTNSIRQFYRIRFP